MDDVNHPQGIRAAERHHALFSSGVVQRACPRNPALSLEAPFPRAQGEGLGMGKVCEADASTRHEGCDYRRTVCEVGHFLSRGCRYGRRVPGKRSRRAQRWSETENVEEMVPKNVPLSASPFPSRIPRQAPVSDRTVRNCA